MKTTQKTHNGQELQNFQLEKMAITALTSSGLRDHKFIMGTTSLATGVHNRRLFKLLALDSATWKRSEKKQLSERVHQLLCEMIAQYQHLDSFSDKRLAAEVIEDYKIVYQRLAGRSFMKPSEP